MRIQILPLPTVMNGDVLEEPFALIIDRCTLDMIDDLAEQANRFKESSGARCLMVTAETVEIVEQYAVPLPQWMREPHPEPETSPASEPEMPARSRYATDAVMYGKRVVIDWPDGPPPGVSRMDLKETLEGYAQALAQHMATKDDDEAGANS